MFQFHSCILTFCSKLFFFFFRVNISVFYILYLCFTFICFTEFYIFIFFHVYFIHLFLYITFFVLLYFLSSFIHLFLYITFFVPTKEYNCTLYSILTVFIYLFRCVLRRFPRNKETAKKIRNFYK